jgi:hypothetical protein
VTPTHNSAGPELGGSVRCGIAAFGSVQFTIDMFPALRKQPGPGIGQSLPNNFLKHTDEQTVASLAAVLQAVDRFSLTESNFRDWGVVAAPAFLGRATLVAALQRYAEEGAWGISPHFIPHCSQHAVAGTISQALKIHGPNFGTGGGPAGTVEAFLAGAVLLEGNQLPGVWAVVSGWEPEMIPDCDGKPTADCTCKAVALALVPAESGHLGLELHVCPVRETEANGRGNGAYRPGAPSFEMLQKALADCRSTPAKLSWLVNSAVVVEIHSGSREHDLPGQVNRQGQGARVRTFEQAGAGTEKKR